jgi:hypothetical protein
MEIEQAEKREQAEKSEQAELIEYLDQMDEKQKLTLTIAQEHLGTSFHLRKSNGFQEWKKKKNKS